MITAQRFYALLEAIKTVRKEISDDIALNVKDLYPIWNGNGKEYKGKDGNDENIVDRVLDDGVLYFCLQSHTSQLDWKPSNTPSLWAEVLIPDSDQIYDWKQPDSTNPYKTGDKVKHNGKVWISDKDNNVWQPGIYGWTEVS